MRILAFVLSAAVLSACTVPPTGGTSTPRATVSAGTVLLARSGLIVEDSRDSLVTFGTQLSVVEARVTPILGPVLSRTSNSECGAGTISFTEFSDITLNSQNGELVGWTTDDTALRTDAGIRVGSGEAVVSAAYTTKFDQGSLGREFEAEGFYGIIENGSVSTFWAGTTCNFR